MHHTRFVSPFSEKPLAPIGPWFNLIKFLSGIFSQSTHQPSDETYHEARAISYVRGREAAEAHGRADPIRSDRRENAEAR